jgi:hypothetical protein
MSRGRFRLPGDREGHNRGEAIDGTKELGRNGTLPFSSPHFLDAIHAALQ